MQPRQDPPEVRLVVDHADTEQTLRLLVVRRQLSQCERPAAATMREIGAELVLGEAQQRRSVPLGLAADVEVLFGDDAASTAIEPGLAAQKFSPVNDALDVEGGAVV